MKTNFTFDELSKAFAAIAKIEAAAAKQIESEKAHEEKSAIFDAELRNTVIPFSTRPRNCK